MRFFISFLTGAFVLMAGSFVYAADEFGERFGDSGNTALEERTAPVEEPRPEDIEPAAGDAAVDDNNPEKKAASPSAASATDPEAEADAEMQAPKTE